MWEWLPGPMTGFEVDPHYALTHACISPISNLFKHKPKVLFVPKIPRSRSFERETEFADVHRPATSNPH